MNINEIIYTAEGNYSKSDIDEINMADINLSKLRRNIDTIRGLLKSDTKLLAVAKGDAYGHGLVPIAKEFESYKCNMIGVVRLSEALVLREAGIKIPILMMAPLIPSQAPIAVEYNITPMVDDMRILSTLEEASVRLNKYVKVHVKVNTGLNRYGVNYMDAFDFILKATSNYSHVKFEGIYTHFKNPENSPCFTHIQIERFNYVLKRLEKKGIRPSIAHAAGSAGILMYPESYFDMVRCGIILYGIEYKRGENLISKGLEPIMTLRSSILKITCIKSGESVGYGEGFKVKRDSRVAVVGIGYADGVSRGWKEVLIGGQRVPIVGYFMDGILVDITDVKLEVREFDEVVIIGTQGEEFITWEEACSSMNAQVDEQMQCITERVPKRYFYEQ